MMYCYDVILKFQKCMKQLPVKDLVCLSYIPAEFTNGLTVFYTIYSS